MRDGRLFFCRPVARIHVKSPFLSSSPTSGVLGHVAATGLYYDVNEYEEASLRFYCGGNIPQPVSRSDP